MPNIPESALELPDDEGLLRVVAAAVESLIQSRPGMDPKWMFDTGRASYKTGRIYVEVAHEDFHDKTRSSPWLYEVRCSRMGRRRVSLLRFTEPSLWRYTKIDPQAPNSVSPSLPTTQKEAERMASEAFTPHYPVQRVSDFAIEHAKRLIRKGKEDA